MQEELLAFSKHSEANQRVIGVPFLCKPSACRSRIAAIIAWFDESLSTLRHILQPSRSE